MPRVRRIVDRWAASPLPKAFLPRSTIWAAASRRRTLDGTLALLADGPDVTVIPSEGVETHRGRAAVEAFFGRIYAAPNRYSWRWRDRWVLDHGAWASFVAIGDEFVEAAGSEPLVIPYCLTGTLVRQGGRWRFLLLHGSEEPSGK